MITRQAYGMFFDAHNRLVVEACNLQRIDVPKISEPFCFGRSQIRTGQKKRAIEVLVTLVVRLFIRFVLRSVSSLSMLVSPALSRDFAMLSLPPQHIPLCQILAIVASQRRARLS